MMDRDQLKARIKQIKARTKALTFAAGWSVKWYQATGQGKISLLTMAGWIALWALGKRKKKMQADSEQLITISTCDSDSTLCYDVSAEPEADNEDLIAAHNLCVRATWRPNPTARHKQSHDNSILSRRRAQELRRLHPI